MKSSSDIIGSGPLTETKRSQTTAAAVVVIPKIMVFSESYLAVSIIEESNWISFALYADRVHHHYDLSSASLMRYVKCINH